MDRGGYPRTKRRWVLHLMSETRIVCLGTEHHHPEDMMTITTANPAIVALLGTPNYAMETRSDFDDLTARMPRRFVSVADHTRIVPGADDLVHPMAGRSGGGVARSVAVLPVMRGHAVKDDAETTHAPRDLRSVAQIDLMSSLIHRIGLLNMDDGMAALEYTAKMTDAGRWTAGRGGNASDWISRLIKKHRELTAAAETVVPTPNATVGGLGNVTSVPNGRYAVADSGPDDIKFYKLRNGTGDWAGRVFISAQASDEFHPIRNLGKIRAILATIDAMGVTESMALYGQHIGRCGRCGRTLTDADSRARGIGPDCLGKL